jgi:hypothetical protein
MRAPEPISSSVVMLGVRHQRDQRGVRDVWAPKPHPWQCRVSAIAIGRAFLTGEGCRRDKPSPDRRNVGANQARSEAVSVSPGARTRSPAEAPAHSPQDLHQRASHAAGEKPGRQRKPHKERDHPNTPRVTRSIEHVP